MVVEKFMIWFDECSSTTSTTITEQSNSSDIKIRQQQLNGLLLNDEEKSYQTMQNTIRSILICWLDMYPEDFYSNDTNDTFTLLNRLIDFAKNRNLFDLKNKARKCREKFKRIVEEGGLQGLVILFK